MEDITSGLEGMPIQCELNTGSALPTFRYVTRNIPGPGSETEMFQTQLCGCDCRQQVQGRDQGQGQDCCDPDAPCPCVTRYGRNYHPHLPQLLPAAALSPSLRPVLECNSRCACGSRCSNRVVQHGPRVRLRVAPSDSAVGFGLFSCQPVPRLTFVCEYAGEVLGVWEAAERLRKREEGCGGGGGGGMNYLIVLREHCASGVVLTCVDPGVMGNVGRFANHSCDPNLVMVPVRVDNPVPRLALFARRDVAAGEELTFDYSGETLLRGSENLLPGGETLLPGGESLTHGGESLLPGGESLTPGGESLLPGGESLTPGGETLLPGGESLTPGGESLLSSDETILPGRETLFHGNESLLPGGESLISGGEILLSRDETLPPGREILIHGNEPLLPGGETLLSSGETLLSSGETLLSSGETLLSSGETLLSSGETLLSGRETLIHGNESLVPGGETFLIGGGALLPSGETLLHGEGHGEEGETDEDARNMDRTSLEGEEDIRNVARTCKGCEIDQDIDVERTSIGGKTDGDIRNVKENFIKGEIVMSVMKSISRTGDRRGKCDNVSEQIKIAVDGESQSQQRVTNSISCDKESKHYSYTQQKVDDNSKTLEVVDTAGNQVSEQPSSRDGERKPLNHHHGTDHGTSQLNCKKKRKLHADDSCQASADDNCLAFAEGVPGKQLSSPKAKTAPSWRKPCFCGSVACKGYLPFEQSIFDVS